MLTVKSLCVMLAILISGVLVSKKASADQIAGTFVSCVDFRGRQVILVADPTLNDIGRATVDGFGNPIMILNPVMMNQLPGVLQLFWYGHECAHHVLGHIAYPSRTRESDADCWSVRTGRNQGWFPPQAFQALTVMLGNNPGSPWGHLPGPLRIQNMVNCYQS